MLEKINENEALTLQKWFNKFYFAMGFKVIFLVLRNVCIRHGNIRICTYFIVL